ncbi:hypothetical protein CPB83DRAFT_798733, partial [Crepidotus variabilis]
MGSLNFLFSLFGWTFIPDLATRNLLKFLYQRSPIRVAQPQPGSFQQRKHYIIVYSLVICGYMIWTIIQSSNNMPPNFYEILGVRPDVDETGLKLAFRAFAKKYHPDRVGPKGEQLFMYVRDAYEALKDPAVRFAYDRFGPDAAGWRKQCKTTREFLRQGLMVSSGYHIFSGIALLFWSAIGKPSSVSFWRYILYFSLLAVELSFILSPFPATPGSFLPPSDPTSMLLPTSSAILQRLWPNRVPYQHILFLHQVFMFFTVALTRVVPQFTTLLGNDDAGARELEPLERAIWERIYGAVAIADREASVILHSIVHSPYHDPTFAAMYPATPQRTMKALEDLTPEMEAMVIEANIKNQREGPIGKAWRAVLSRNPS